MSLLLSNIDDPKLSMRSRLEKLPFSLYSDKNLKYTGSALSLFSHVTRVNFRSTKNPLYGHTEMGLYSHFSNIKLVKPQLHVTTIFQQS